MDGREDRRGGRRRDEGRRKEGGRCEGGIATTCGIQVSSIASGEGLINTAIK